MLWWLIPTILIGLSLLAILAVLLRNVKQLRVLDVASTPREKAKKLKEDLIMKRFDRMRSDKLGGVAKKAGEAAGLFSRIGRRLVQKLYAIEQYYERLKTSPTEGGSLDEKTIKRMLADALKLVKEEEYIPAEKKYIEVISHNPRSIAAYEGLADLYMELKKYDQVRETLQFVLRLDEKDIQALIAFHNLEKREGNLDKAFSYIQKAIEVEPKNPKVLDSYIDLALELGMLSDAKKGLALMKQVNPENSKLENWEKQVDERERARKEKQKKKKKEKSTSEE